MSRQFISSGSIFEQEIGYSRAIVDGDWVFVSGSASSLHFTHSRRLGTKLASNS
jgi:hypothetical protein